MPGGTTGPEAMAASEGDRKEAPGARLRYPHGRGRADLFPLHPDGPTLFGRGEECDHRLPSGYLSRRHFTILPDGEGYLLLDLDSRNGTFLHERWVRIARLAEGDVIRAGNRLLIFETGETETRCSGCHRIVTSSDSSLCVVCRHRYPLLGERVAGVDVDAPLGERPGLVDYHGRREGESRPLRLRVLEGGAPRRILASLASFAHPRVVAVREHGKHGGANLLVTDCPPRVTLAHLLQTRLPTPADLVTDVMRGVAEALARAHAQGIVHGALGPDRVGVDELGQAALDDLGLHDCLPTEQAETDWFVPPERRGQRKRSDRADDVFGFGATFYHVLTRRPPVPDYARGRVDAARPLASRRPDLPARTAFLIGKALANDPKERYGTFEEILTDLR